jgi:hypothetical protein
MKTSHLPTLLAAALISALAVTTTRAADAPKMTTAIPPEITTPDSVETRLGTLKFVDGFPDKETTQKVYDNLDFQRGVQAFLTCIPGASASALRHGFRAFGPDNQTVVLFENLMEKGIVTNADSSVDVYFGPTAPAGHEANWVQTIPGKGWNAILRAYGPLEPWFDKTWRPGEIELVK